MSTYSISANVSHGEACERQESTRSGACNATRFCSFLPHGEMQKVNRAQRVYILPASLGSKPRDTFKMSLRSGAGTVEGVPYSVADSAAAPGSLPGYGASNPMERAVASAATGVADPKTPSVYEAYYGPAPAGLQGVDVMGHIARTNLTLPAYYQGKNMYLERVISWGVADLEDWPTTAFLPLIPYDGMTFTFSKMQATPHILDRVPEEAASRLVTTQFELQEASTERYGLAFRMEHGLLGTPLGEKMWTSNIRQIVEATVRSIHLAIMNLAIVQETYFTALAATRLRMQSESVKARQVLAHQTQLFGCIQKKYGLEQAVGNMLSIFKDRGVKADMAIVPADTAGLLRCRNETRDFMINGALAQMYQLDPQRSLPCYVHSTNLAMFEHRGYFADQMDHRANALVRQREIGQYFVMKYDPSRKLIPGVPGQRDIMVIDHNRQCWVRIKFIDALRASGYFNGDGETLNIDVFSGDTEEVVAASRAQGRKRSTPVSSKTKKSKTRAGAKGRVNVGGPAPGGLAPVDRDNWRDDLIQKKIESFGVKDVRGTWIFEKQNIGEESTQEGQNSSQVINYLLSPEEYDLPEKATSGGVAKQIYDKNKLSGTPGGKANPRRSTPAEETYVAPAPTPRVNPYPRGGVTDIPKAGSGIEEKDVLPRVLQMQRGVTTLENVETALEVGIDIPISLYLLRPHMRFRMGGMVVGAGGEQTGFTVVGNSNFELSDEATTKTALGHYTTYFKPIIHTPKNVMVCPDAVFQGYLGGGGVRMTSIQNYQRGTAADPTEWNDIVVIGTESEDSMDGVVPLCGDFEDERMNSYMKSLKHMSSTNIGENSLLKRARQAFMLKGDYRNYIGFRDELQEGVGNMDRYNYAERYRGYNLLCFQGRQKCFRQTTSNSGDFSHEIRGRGHLRGCEYVDSSINEWTGCMTFRDEPNLRVDMEGQY